MKTFGSGRLLALVALFGALCLGIPAEAQKKLVVYSANESTLNDLAFNAFNKETGVQVEPVASPRPLPSAPS